MIDADLVVVGSGPAGSAAAYNAKKHGLEQVVLLEKRAGPHASCAGGAGWHWAEEMGLTIPQHLVETEVRRVAIHGPTKTAHITRDDLGVDVLGWVLDRPGFDDWLLKRAEAEGAWVRRQTEYEHIERDNGAWRVDATHHPAGEVLQIRAPYVVDASGPQAVVAADLGLSIDRDDQDLHTGLQYTVPVPSDYDMNRLSLWFKADAEDAGDWAVPSGYVWSFPSRHPYKAGQIPGADGRYTRLGCGVDQVHEHGGIPARDVLDDFMDHHPTYDAEPVSTNGGIIPTGKYQDTAHEGVFLAGDAGRHTSALHGGGIVFGYQAGLEAGRVAAEGGSDKDYVKAWKDRVGWQLKVHYGLKKCLYSFSNADMDAMVRAIQDFEVESPDPFNEIPRAAKALIEHPRLGAKTAVRTFKGMVTG